MCEQLEEEPNEDPSTNAVVHGPSNCKTEYRSMVGTLATAEDLDWHFYVGQESSPCKSSRLHAKHEVTADAAVTVCVVPYCQSGTKAIIECEAGQIDDMKTACCATGTEMMVQAQIDCADAESEDVYVYVAVLQAAEQCLNYEVEYKYDDAS